MASTRQDSWQNASSMYEYLTSDSSLDSRLVRSVERIRTVCDEIESQAYIHLKVGGTFKRSPIYIAEVGRRCAARFGGPTADSIVRNRAKEPLKAAYIELRSEELRSSLGLRSEVEIKDMRANSGQNAYILSLEQKVKVGERMIAGLSQTVRNIRAVSLKDALRDGRVGEDESVDISAGVQSMPSGREVADLATKLLDSRLLSRFGLVLDRAVFNPATGEELLSSEDVALLLRLK